MKKIRLKFLYPHCDAGSIPKSNQLCKSVCGQMTPVNCPPVRCPHLLNNRVKSPLGQTPPTYLGDTSHPVKRPLRSNDPFHK